MFKKVTIRGQEVTYSVADEIENNHYRYDNHDARIERLMTEWPERDRAYVTDLIQKPSKRLDRDEDTYPRTDTYQFQEFAGYVFELGGYGDMSIIDPYTRVRLWVGDALNQNTTIWDSMRKVIDVAEAVGWPECGATDQDPPELSLVKDDSND